MLLLLFDLYSEHFFYKIYHLEYPTTESHTKQESLLSKVTVKLLSSLSRFIDFIYLFTVLITVNTLTFYIKLQNKSSQNSLFLYHPNSIVFVLFSKNTKKKYKKETV